MFTLPGEIFKAYDIRGIVGRTLTPEIVEQIGRAIGSEALARGGAKVAIGHDGRLSGPTLAAALARGIQASGVGCDRRRAHHDADGVLRRASFEDRLRRRRHRQPQSARLQRAEDRSVRSRRSTERGYRSCASVSRTGDFAQRRRNLRAAGHFPRLPRARHRRRQARATHEARRRLRQRRAGRVRAGALPRTGLRSHEFFCEVDGNFPNHHPDPSQPENLHDVIAALREGKGELGFAFDGDGDRLGVVTRNGRIIYPDRQLMLFAADVLKRQPGRQHHLRHQVNAQPRAVGQAARRHARPVEDRAFAHQEEAAGNRRALAGEMSGHLFFKERWYGFDDALYAGARLLEITLAGKRSQRGARGPAGRASARRSCT